MSTRVVNPTLKLYPCSVSRRVQFRKLQRNALPSEVSLAISQQTIAFGVVLVGEALYARSRLPEDDPARPSLPSLGISVAGYGATVGLLSVETNFVQIAGILAGLVTTGQVLTVSVNRITKTKSDPSSWPGPRSWPFVISLAASSVALAFIQSFPNFNI